MAGHPWSSYGPPPRKIKKMRKYANSDKWVPVLPGHETKTTTDSKGKETPVEYEERDATPNDVREFTKMAHRGRRAVSSTPDLLPAMLDRLPRHWRAG